MKISFLLICLLVVFSCNNQAAGVNAKDDPVLARDATAAAGDCGSRILFRKGSRLTTEARDGEGKLLASSVAEVTNVTGSGGRKVSEVSMLSTAPGQKESDRSTGRFSCDGNSLVMDLSAFIQKKEGMKITSDGLAFPVRPSIGSTLPDAGYTLVVEYGGKQMKMVSTITDRKVESKEELTTPAGTFDVYKITSRIDVKTEMPGLTPAMQQEMEAAKAKMGKNSMIFWYDPAVTVIRSEIYVGGKLTVSNLLTSLK